MEFLDIEMSKDEQVSYFSTQTNQIKDTMGGMYETLQTITRLLEEKNNREPQEQTENNIIECDELVDKPRSVDEIAEAIEEFFEKIWFDRHLSLSYRVDSGLTTVAPEIWEGALKSAQRVIDKYGEENLGPYSDFDSIPKFV